MKSVCIVGGGLAGLTAAHELVRQGFAVTIIEAKANFGGRVFTLHHKGSPIELGAEFVHGRDPGLLKMLTTAGLKAHKVSDRYQIWEKGRLRPIDLWGKVERVINKVNTRLPDTAFSEFLTSQKLHQRTKHLATAFVEGFDAAYPDRVSAHSLLRAQEAAEVMEGNWQGRVDRGYLAFVDFLTKKIQEKGGRLVGGTLVREIVWKQGTVEIRALENGRKRIFKSEAAIVTLPIGVWKANVVKFHPFLPEKQAVARELEFGNVVKIVLVFRQKWWPEKTGFIQAPDELIPTWWTDPRGLILTGWAGGPKADALLSGLVSLEKLGLDILGRIFSERTASLHDQLAASYFHNWAADPYARGAYSYIPVGGLELPKLLAEPVAETLFFAGEAAVADAQMGTVFGALESGKRAAREVADALGR